MTSTLVNNVLAALGQVAPNAPVVEVAEAAVNTAADPTSPSVILADLELLVSLISKFKAAAPTLLAEVKALL